MTFPISTLTSPRFTALVNVIGVLSLLISVVFWWDGRSVADVTFYASPIQPAVVLREELTGDLKLDGQPISGNVYAARLYIWNAGKKSVTANDILSSFKIRTKNIETLDRVISVRVVAQSRSEVNAKVKLIEKNVVRPEWELLEDKDGFYIQLVYVAVAPVEWQVEGAMVGQQKISKWDASITYDTNGKLNLSPTWWKGLLALAIWFVVLQLLAKPYRTFVGSLNYFKVSEGSKSKLVKRFAKFVVEDFLPIAILGALLVFCLELAKSWGAPPVFWF